VIRIGSVVFDVVKPCSRCIFHHRQSLKKARKHPSGEPLKTLQSFRTAQDNGDVDFGQNLIPRSSGVIRAGDEVEILATCPRQECTAQVTDEEFEDVEIEVQPATAVDPSVAGQNAIQRQQSAGLARTAGASGDPCSLLLSRGRHLWELSHQRWSKGEVSGAEKIGGRR
jgi:hypothetical protein